MPSLVRLSVTSPGMSVKEQLLLPVSTEMLPLPAQRKKTENIQSNILSPLQGSFPSKILIYLLY